MTRLKLLISYHPWLLPLFLFVIGIEVLFNGCSGSSSDEEEPISPNSIGQMEHNQYVCAVSTALANPQFCGLDPVVVAGVVTLAGGTAVLLHKTMSEFMTLYNDYEAEMHTEWGDIRDLQNGDLSLDEYKRRWPGISVCPGDNATFYTWDACQQYCYRNFGQSCV